MAAGEGGVEGGGIEGQPDGVEGQSSKDRRTSVFSRKKRSEPPGRARGYL
jgi:hypothetical protein